jgi:putative membrane protein
MTAEPIVAKWQSVLMWAALVLYMQARICQLYADRLPALLIVILHVLPPAVFACVHGSVLYRGRGILAFAAFCLGVGGLNESLSLRTGFPFGHYYFTDVMGPKILDLPILLVLAYFGIGYCSWVLSLLILGYRSAPLTGARVVALPVLASFVMLAWDLSMEADWSTVDRAWIWQNGGLFYGVPVSNFLGWYLTAYLFYQAFALFCSKYPIVRPISSRQYWDTAILFYLVCAGGNLLILKLPMAPPVVTDASGKQWITIHILIADALISLFLMGSLALTAWLRMKAHDRAAAASQQETLAICPDST